MHAVHTTKPGLKLPEVHTTSGRFGRFGTAWAADIAAWAADIADIAICITSTPTSSSFTWQEAYSTSVHGDCKLTLPRAYMK